MYYRKGFKLNKPRILLNKAPAEVSARTTGREDFSPAQSIRRRHLIRLYLTAILLLSMMFTVYIWQSTKMVEVKLRIKKVQKDIESLENSNSDFRAEISKLQSLTRIETVAKQELGMVEPKKLVYIRMPDNWNKK